MTKRKILPSAIHHPDQLDSSRLFDQGKIVRMGRVARGLGKLLGKLEVSMSPNMSTPVNISSFGVQTRPTTERS